MIVSDCPACSGQGGQHVCAGSGTFLAAEAHVEGELVPPEEWPSFLVTIHGRIRAEDEQQVREKLTRLVGDLLDDDLVEHVDFSLETIA